ncbi:HORMA domain-containing protein 1 [Halocaridina rubra]|uniref:HORMA domain-containing protein 1 n=1 Tax=Halocaridina rubra TaxID=373956 RepID=A0AAN8WLD1_HALRR
MLSTRVQLMPNATLQTVSQGTSTWSTLFPVEQKTVQQSATFVKKLIAVGFSSITYLRTLFPEYAYSDENLDGLNLKLLLDNSTCGPAKELVKWIQSCFDAIDKRYLRELTLAIFTDPDHPELVLETYTYRLRYTKEGDAQMEFESTTASGKREQKFDVRRPTQKLLRTVILLTQALRPLPKRVFLGMKLGYYDDAVVMYNTILKVPVYPHYIHESHLWPTSSPFAWQLQPQHLSPNILLIFPKNLPSLLNINTNPPPRFWKFCLSNCHGTKYKIGEVSTRFHSVKVRVSVDRKHFSDDKSAAESYHDEGIEGKTEDENKNGNIEIIRRFSAKNVSQTPPLLGKDTCSSYSSSQNFYPATSIRKADLSTIDPVKETEVMDLDQPCCSGSRSQEPKNIMNKTISDMATPGAAETMKYMLAASTPDISPTVSEMPENQTTLDAEHSFASTSYSNVRTPSVYNNCTTPGSTTSMRSQGVLISPSVPNPDFPVRCPCGVSLDDGLMILCDKCGNWQHAVRS